MAWPNREMPSLRSHVVTNGRNMAGARALLRAAGVAASDFGKPIVAVANSFAEFVPGHTHLRSEEHTSELQSLLRISYAVFCLKQKHTTNRTKVTYADINA